MPTTKQIAVGNKVHYTIIATYIYIYIYFGRAPYIFIEVSEGCSLVAVYVMAVVFGKYIILGFLLLCIMYLRVCVYYTGLVPDTQNCGLRMRRECRERFPRHRLLRKPLVNDPSMHHGTCVTHVPWCMSGSLTCGEGEKFPAFPAHAQPAILHIWQESHGQARNINYWSQMLSTVGCCIRTAQYTVILKRTL